MLDAEYSMLDTGYLIFDTCGHGSTLLIVYSVWCVLYHIVSLVSSELFPRRRKGAKKMGTKGKTTALRARKITEGREKMKESILPPLGCETLDRVSGFGLVVRHFLGK